jgi:aspartyl-tRNA(Asn)/glutamyl-tRNA(Gln) amidotransferase subunit B
MAAYFEAAAKASGQPKLASNWIMGELSRRSNAEDRPFTAMPVSAETLAALINRISDATISNNAARAVFDELWTRSLSADTRPGQPQAAVDAIIEAKGLRQMSDAGALEKIVDDVIAANADNVAQFKAGKDKAFNALVGQVMKASKGKANPAQVNELLKKKLS